MFKQMVSALFQALAALAESQRDPIAYLMIAVGLGAMLGLSSDPSYVDVHLIAVPLFWVALCFFAGEWLVDLFAADQQGKLRAYALSTRGLVDGFGALAIPISLTMGASLSTASLLATAWLFKPLARFSSLGLLRRVIVREARPLATVLVLFLLALFTIAVLVFLVERTRQPATFGTLSGALWWAVVTLTTTGYGDAVPVSLIGRMLAASLMIAGLGIFGLWTGILANGFATEHRRYEWLQTWEVLQRVPFFAALGSATLADIATVLRRVHFRAHTAVVRQGETGDCMYFVADGEVEVLLPGKKIVLGQGAFFGEMALLGSEYRTATVVTTRAATLLMLDLIDFRNLMARHPDLAGAITQEAAARSQQLAAIRG